MANIDMFSVIPLLVVQLFQGQPMGSATGFVWQRGSDYFLITNYHVVSGIDPNTGKVKDSEGKTPDALRVFHNGTRLGEWTTVDYPVLGKKREPIWLEHPEGRQVDVVALKISTAPGISLYALNAEPLIHLSLKPAETVSIVGFPAGQTAGGVYAIWQTGYVASEPELDFAQRPVVLLDCKAWPGNSGSPVIARRYGSWTTSAGAYQVIADGKATDFIGVMSGSVGEAQLRVVWKAKILDEIIDQRVH